MSGETKSIIAMVLVCSLIAVMLCALGALLLLVEPEEAAAAPTSIASPLRPSPEGGASPTFHVLSTLPPVTNTPAPTNTPTPTNTPPPTDPPASTDVPPTDAPQPTDPPASVPTNPPAPTDPPAPPPASSRGLTSTFQVEGGPTFGANQSIWFNFQLLNPTGSPVRFGRLGVSAEENGANQSDMFHTSYSETTLQPNDGLFNNYRDHITIPRAGTFVLRLTICYPSIGACDGGSGEWEQLSGGVTVTIQ